MMTAFILILSAALSSTLWQEEFADTTEVIRQLYDYSVEIASEEGIVSLKANPQFEGFAAAWFYVDEDIAFGCDDVLQVVIRVNDNAVRLRYFCRMDGCDVYFGGEITISQTEDWHKVEIPLRDAKPYYSSEYPYALTPGKKPCLYVFIDNELPGNYDVELDRISVSGPDQEKEER
jgi:hypothetical protein